TVYVDFLFDQLFFFKQHEALTWFHHACYKALKNDKAGALKSLEKSLRLGFGGYFQLMSDKDLDFIRDSQEFKALAGQFFPPG
ncbi:MAG: TPR end-of-group domain-containing protein, partial [Bacteroidota bacterium]